VTTVISRHLERGKKAGVPVEFRRSTSRIQIYWVTTTPICGLRQQLNSQIWFQKPLKVTLRYVTLRKKIFHKDEFILTSEIALFCTRILENVHHRIEEKKHTLFHRIYSCTVSEINVTIFVYSRNCIFSNDLPKTRDYRILTSAVAIKNKIPPTSNNVFTRTFM
jgi:hypothetical protein